MVVAGLVVLGVVVVVGLVAASGALLLWNEVRYRKKGLPPGTMGWPLFGETTEFLKQGPSFMKSQKARYGSIFKSHILGCPTVVSMDPELNRFILMNEKEGLVPGYPQSMLDILGKCNIAAVHGSLHRAMRGALLAVINPATMRDQLLPKVDELVRSHLAGWAGSVVDIQTKTKEMAFLSSLKQIAGIEAGPISEAFKPQFQKLLLGTLSLPIDLPGTNYRHGLQARKRITKILKEMIEQRRASTARHHDMLQTLLSYIDSSKAQLTEDHLIDLIITIIYSGYETVSTTSMMVVKYLHDNPRALEELRKEHLEIRSRKSPEDAVDWNDLKSMSFTRAAIYEAMRLATIVNGVLRKTTRDMEMKGYTIPEGWKIYVYTREINYDPYIYPDPMAFNPWRWQDKSLESHQHFMLFGGGSRLCPGRESGVAEISTFLHYFVTRYRWEEVAGGTLQTFPRVEAPQGLHIRVSEYQS